VYVFDKKKYHKEQIYGYIYFLIVFLKLHRYEMGLLRSSKMTER